MTLKKILREMLAGLIVLTSTVVIASETDKSAATNNSYSEDKVNITVDAKHPTFVIKLKSNPTTGYSWFLREYDANLISPVKHTFVKPTENAIGASGAEVWTFKVKPLGFTVPQQTAIRMIYARPWQGAEGSTPLVFRVTTSK